MAVVYFNKFLTASFEICFFQRLLQSVTWVYLIGQAKFPDGGQVLGLSQFSILS